MSPTVRAGTHVRSVGADAVASFPLSPALTIQPRLGGRAYQHNLGIPGASFGAVAELRTTLSFGRSGGGSGGSGAARGRPHHVSYYLVSYTASDSTSQLSGGIVYERTGRGGAVRVTFENDALALQRLDRYRTFALRARWRQASGAEYGVGGSLVFWTGTTEGLGFLSRGETYDLTGQYGGAYSHGIASLDLHRGPVRLSLGYDAEWIRTPIQNGFHYLIDDGRIPALDRRGRPFVELSINDVFALY